MNLNDLEPGLYTGIIVGRSVDVPSPADQVSYTVAININNSSVSLPDVVPQRGARWTEYMPLGPDGEQPNINPFPLGHRVPIHFDRQGDDFILYIDRGELPAFGGCP
jgi:hypothetical protein